MLTAANLIDAIICHQINQPDQSKSSLQAVNSLSQKDQNKSFNPTANVPSYGNNFLNDHIKNWLNDNYNSSKYQMPPELPITTTANQSIINPLHLLQDHNLLSTASSANLIATTSAKSAADESWKLRTALEQKEARKENKNELSHIEIEPISPPSNAPTPTKEQTAACSAANLKQWSNELTQSSLANIQLANKSSANDPIAFQKYFQNRIAQAMNTEQQQQVDKESDFISKKKVKMDDENLSGEDTLKKDSSKIDQLTEKLPLESISSLSELKAQRTEFQKQQLKMSSEKAD